MRGFLADFTSFSLLEGRISSEFQLLIAAIGESSSFMYDCFLLETSLPEMLWPSVSGLSSALSQCQVGAFTIFIYQVCFYCYYLYRWLPVWSCRIESCDFRPESEMHLWTFNLFKQLLSMPYYEGSLLWLVLLSFWRKDTVQISFLIANWKKIRISS